MILGIDPGLSGGWAVLGDLPPFAEPLPIVGGSIDVGVLYRRVRLDFGTPDLVVIEKVGAMPKQGVSSMFKFGTGWGQLIGMCQTAGWPYILVTPPAWQKLILSGLAKGKASAIAYTAARYPEVQLVQPRCRVPHDGVADAVCLAEFGVRSLAGR